MAKKKADLKAKAKRQKVFLAVGGVLLLGLLAFQVPRTMKMLNAQSQSTASSGTTSTTTTTAGSTPLAPPTLDGSATAGTSSSGATPAASSATSVDGVSDPSNPLPPNAGQLVSFSKFKSKDPFHQQITDCATSVSADPAASADTAGTNCAPRSTSGTSKPGSSTVPSTIVVSSKPAARGSTSVSAKPTKATISVNGLPSTVSVNASFPSGAPVFTLVSLTRRAAKIGILGGSYENGAGAVTLAKGKTVTLMNTADGSRYVLRLLAVE
jgi:hypothetical protein